MHAVADGVGNDHRNRGFVETHGPFEPLEGREKGIGHVAGHAIAQMVAHPIQLGAIHEQIDRAVCVEDGKPLGNRIARNVCTTDVEQPADGIGQGDHGTGRTRIRQCPAQTRAFVLVAFAGKFKRMNLGRLRGRAGLVRPYTVHQIGALHQIDRAARKALARLFHLSRRVQPGVKADATAVRQLLFQPVRQTDIGPGDGGVDIGHLRLDLRAVTPVNEHARHILQDGGKPGRAGEPGQPGQPLVPGRDIFPLMGIRTGHQKAVQPFGRDLGAQRRQPGWPLFGAGSDLK